jgi:hypothetical protein
MDAATSERKEPLFSLGRVVATPGAIAALDEAEQAPQEFLVRHITGDWGVVPEEDKKANDWSVTNGARILSSYLTNKGTKFWIITEHDRSVTTFLLPMEY